VAGTISGVVSVAASNAIPVELYSLSFTIVGDTTVIVSVMVEENDIIVVMVSGPAVRTAGYGTMSALSAFTQ
jgi:hypothetical protein